MIHLPITEFEKLFKEKGFIVHPELNIVGMRNRFARTNYFDDTISVYSKDLAYHFDATTFPGSPNLLKPVNPDGTAILVPGQYIDAYQIGMHRGKYEALIQRRPVRVYRDNTRDVQYDRNARSIQEGYFGINIHRASFAANFVGADSAGCQVIRDREDFEWLMELCVDSGLKEFTYTLVEI